MKNEQSEPTHLFATIGALTERGGRVTQATSGLAVAGLAVARVGDVVTYDDGSEAVITDGAGNYAVCRDKPFALVGSRLSNGDRIVETLQLLWGIHVLAGETVDGLFDPAYVPPPAPSRYGSQCEEQRLREVAYCEMLPEHGISVSGLATLVSLATRSTMQMVRPRESSAASRWWITGISNRWPSLEANSITATPLRIARNARVSHLPVPSRR